MRTLTRWGAIITCGLSLCFFSCPTYEPPLPSPLSSPVIEHTELVIENIDKQWREAVRIDWELPVQNEIPVQSYVLLRKTIVDSDFVVRIQSIPPSVSSAHDLLSASIFPGENYETILYRIYAIDSLKRPSDTSLTDTLIVVPRPLLKSPAAGDTLSDRLFSWSTIDIRTFYSYISLYDSERCLWKSSRGSHPFYPGSGEFVVPPVRLPDSIALQGQHTHWWAVHIDVDDGNPNVTTGSIALGEFYVP
jgi:hypothetical protein